MKSVTSTLFVLSFFLAVVGCTKDKRERPSASLKTDESYTYADATTDTSTLVKFGFVADKTQNPLKIFNVSVVFDGNPTVYNVESFTLSNEQATHFERDLSIKTHPTASIEKWIFSVTDADGNSAQK